MAIKELFYQTEIQHVEKQLKDTLYPENLKDLFDDESMNSAFEHIKKWENYQPTPLINLEKLATVLGIGRILYKDESERFSLKSFKALGGAYALQVKICELLTTKLGKKIHFADLSTPEIKSEIAKLMIITATDGNHGRSVAWGCQQIGCPCRIYMHEGVSQYREEAVKDLGATVIRVKGNYDASLVAVGKDADQHGWQIISDTSFGDYLEVPRWIMNGYTVMVKEMLDCDMAPTHVFAQGGVGGLAAGVFAPFWQWFDKKPTFVVVEPHNADCLLQSAKQGAMTSINITEETIMAGLSCGTPSVLAWRLLERGVEHFISIDDALIAPTMQGLYNADFHKERIIAGESAVTGLSALISIAVQPKLREKMGLNEESQVVLFGSEGDTDPEIFQKLLEV